MKKKSDLKLRRHTHVCLFLTVPSAPTQEGLNDGDGDDGDDFNLLGRQAEAALVVVCRLLIVMPSLVAEHRLYVCGLL